MGVVSNKTQIEMKRNSEWLLRFAAEAYAACKSKSQYPTKRLIGNVELVIGQAVVLRGTIAKALAERRGGAL